MLASKVELFFEQVASHIAPLQVLQVQIEPDSTPIRDHENYQVIDRTLRKVIRACNDIDADLQHDEGLLRETRTRFQELIAPCLTQGWVGRRVVEKPRGYAGDYRTLIAIYDKGPVEKGFGGLVDLWLLEEILLTKSIRSRWQEMRKFLTREISKRSGEVSVLDIASGPCREFSKPLELTSDAVVTLQCLDNDPESLDYVRDNVVKGSGIRDFRLNQYNALRLKNSRATTDAFGTFDIVYSIGLFDYIDDKRLVNILAGVKDLVNEGGVVYLNFKDAAEYDKVEYQWIFDWHFFQRTEQDCLDLFEQAGYDLEKMEPTTRDETRVIINFVNRPTMVTTRIDGASGIARPKSRLSTPSDIPD